MDTAVSFTITCVSLASKYFCLKSVQSYSPLERSKKIAYVAYTYTYTSVRLSSAVKLRRSPTTRNHATLFLHQEKVHAFIESVYGHQVLQLAYSIFLSSTRKYRKELTPVFTKYHDYATDRILRFCGSAAPQSNFNAFIGKFRLHLKSLSILSHLCVLTSVW